MKLTGSKIVKVVLKGGDGQGNLIRIKRQPISVLKDKENKSIHSLVYTSFLDLDLREIKDKWGIVLFVQNVNNVPIGTDPIVAARTIGGITVSSNIEDIGNCTLVMALDHIFDVI